MSDELSDYALAARAVEPTGSSFWPWLAGFIDGEGSIGLHRERDRRKGEDYKTYRPALQIANCDKDALILIQHCIGAGQIVHVANHNERHREQWRYGLRNAKLGRVLERLQPYLVIKRRQADLVLLYLRSREVSWARGWFKPYQRVAPILFDQLREANKRGPR